MSTVTEPKLPHPSVLADRGAVPQPWEGHTARLEIRRLNTAVAVVTAYGEIDESNAATLAECTLEHITGCRGLILDLRSLDFFGAKGFSALNKISAGCARACISWAVVPGAVVSRLLRICDPQGTLPAAGALVAALADEVRKTKVARSAYDREGRPAINAAPTAISVTATTCTVLPSKSNAS